MLRITEVSNDDKTVTLKLEGKLVGKWIQELENICLYHRNDRDDTVMLDLAGVTFIGKKGVKMLEAIKDDRIKIANCSPFIVSLLSELISSDKQQLK